MAQHAILRFEKHKGNPARPLEAHHERQKEQYATPMGRAMLNICIVFAQLERETIQKRVTDAYYSRSQRGFKMGGKAPYGFHTEPIKMDEYKKSWW